MPTIYRISRPGIEPVTDANTVEAIERVVMPRISHTIHPELIKLAVRDALDQRKPR